MYIESLTLENIRTFIFSTIPFKVSGGLSLSSLFERTKSADTGDADPPAVS